MIRATSSLPGFRIIGCGARTSNEREFSGSGQIGALWAKFLAEGDAVLLDEADRSAIYAIYTNYGSDHNGLYEIVIGRAVSETAVSPEGWTAVAIPASDYMEFPAAGKDVVDIIAAWRAVYDWFEQNPMPRRAFTADFEKYSPDGVSLFIAVAPHVVS